MSSRKGGNPPFEPPRKYRPSVRIDGGYVGCCYKSAVYSYHFRFAGQVRRPATSDFCVCIIYNYL